MPTPSEKLDLAMRAFERIKTSDLTMDGYTTFHGRLSMDEVVAFNELFALLYKLSDPDKVLTFYRNPITGLTMSLTVADFLTALDKETP